MMEQELHTAITPDGKAMIYYVYETGEVVAMVPLETYDDYRYEVPAQAVRDDANVHCGCGCQNRKA